MKRTAPLKRGSDGLTRSRPFKTKRRKRPAMDPELRRLVFLRAGGRCDACGRPLPADGWEAHHRQLRSRAGADTLENLVALCRDCHVPYVHAHPAEATERGLMVSTYEDPANVPVRRGDGRLYMPDGRHWRRINDTGETTP